MNRTMAQVAWMAVAVLGAAALGIVALNRGETVNAAWMVIAAVCVYLIAYRFYSLFISSRVLQLDPTRMSAPHPSGRTHRTQPAGPAHPGGLGPQLYRDAQTRR